MSSHHESSVSEKDVWDEDLSAVRYLHLVLIHSSLTLTNRPNLEEVSLLQFISTSLFFFSTVLIVSLEKQ